MPDTSKTGEQTSTIWHLMEFLRNEDRPMWFRRKRTSDYPPDAANAGYGQTQGEGNYAGSPDDRISDNPNLWEAIGQIPMVIVPIRGRAIQNHSMLETYIGAYRGYVPWSYKVDISDHIVSMDDNRSQLEFRVEAIVPSPEKTFRTVELKWLPTTATFEDTPLGDGVEDEEGEPELLPDLHDDGIEFSGFYPLAVRLGTNLYAWNAVRNSGTADAGAFTIKFYLSTDTTISESDYYLGSVEMEAILAGEVGYCNFSGAIPAGILAGSYYVGWIIDSEAVVEESNETNNVAYCSNQLIVTQPIIALNVTNLTPVSWYMGGTYIPRYYTCVEKGTDAASQTFKINNSANVPRGTLTYAITVDANWLSCTPSSGTSTGEQDTITVNYNTDALAEGEYTANITITSPWATNSPQVIPVTMYVKENPCIVCQSSYLTPATWAVIIAGIEGTCDGLNGTYELHWIGPCAWGTHENILDEGTYPRVFLHLARISGTSNQLTIDVHYNDSAGIHFTQYYAPAIDICNFVGEEIPWDYGSSPCKETNEGYTCVVTANH